MRGRNHRNNNGGPKTAIKKETEANRSQCSNEHVKLQEIGVLKISLESKGLLAYIFSQPKTWFFTVDQACKDNRIGRKKMYRILRELISKGLCERELERGLNNTFSSTNYTFRTNKKINSPITNSKSSSLI